MSGDIFLGNDSRRMCDGCKALTDTRDESCLMNPRCPFNPENGLKKSFYEATGRVAFNSEGSILVTLSNIKQLEFPKSSEDKEK